MRQLRLTYSYYGWRARIGLLVPSTNVSMEPEFYLMAPEGVSIHSSRLVVSGASSLESYASMAAQTGEAASRLKMIDPTVMVFGCTSGSFIENENEIRKKIESKTGAPAVTTSGAVIEALKYLGVHSIAVATPYVDFINEEEKKWLQARGFHVKELQGLQLGKNEFDRKLKGRQPTQIAYELAFRVARSNPECVFISCTNFASVPIIEVLESDLGIPVITSNQASLWAALRTAGLKLKIEGYGVLMRK
ncbi:MAG: maleate cis-trans isomerase family protein [Candidatus Hodarchaeales archaeon]